MRGHLLPGWWDKAAKLCLSCAGRIICAGVAAVAAYGVSLRGMFTLNIMIGLRSHICLHPHAHTHGTITPFTALLGSHLLCHACSRNSIYQINCVRISAYVCVCVCVSINPIGPSCPNDMGVIANCAPCDSLPVRCQDMADRQPEQCNLN